MSKKLIAGIIGLMVFSWFIGFAMGVLGASLPGGDDVMPVPVAVPPLEPIPELIIPEPIAPIPRPIIISELLPTSDDVPSGWIVDHNASREVTILGDVPLGLEESIRGFYIGRSTEFVEFPPFITIEIFEFDSIANAEAYYNAETDNEAEECQMNIISRNLVTIHCHGGNIVFSVFSGDFGEYTAEKFASEFAGIVAGNLLEAIL